VGPARPTRWRDRVVYGQLAPGIDHTLQRQIVTAVKAATSHTENGRCERHDRHHLRRMNDGRGAVHIGRVGPACLAARIAAADRLGRTRARRRSPAPLRSGQTLIADVVINYLCGWRRPDISTSPVASTPLVTDDGVRKLIRKR
jgi:hypothetical protein